LQTSQTSFEAQISPLASFFSFLMLAQCFSRAATIRARAASLIWRMGWSAESAESAESDSSGWPRHLATQSDNWLRLQLLNLIVALLRFAVLDTPEHGIPQNQVANLLQRKDGDNRSN